MTRVRVRLDTPTGLIELPPGIYLIGRGPECTVVLGSGLVSRQHARLVVEEGGASIEDLTTPNGTFLNGARIAERRALTDADFVVIGEVALEFNIEALRVSELAAPAVPPAPMAPYRVSRSSAPPTGASQHGPQHLQTIPAQAHEVLQATADPFFEQGQLPLAERVLEGWLSQVLLAVKTGAPRELGGDHAALRQAARLARALVSVRWVNYVVELATRLPLPLHVTELDLLEPVVRQVGVSGQLLDAYVLRLRTPPVDQAAAGTLERVEQWRAFVSMR